LAKGGKGRVGEGESEKGKIGGEKRLLMRVCRKELPGGGRA